MGLPLYIAPVESDLRNKHSTARNSPTHGPNRIRRTRRSTEALVESRRRAILTATATLPHFEGLTETQRAVFREQQRDLDEVQELMEQRHALQYGLSPNWPRARLARTREPLAPSASSPSTQELAANTASNPSRDRLLQHYLGRTRDQEQSRAAAILSREQATASINASNANGNAANGASRAASGVNASSASGLRDEHRRWYEHIVSRSRGQATPSNEGAGSPMTAAITGDLEDSGDRYSRELLAALGSRLASSSVFEHGLNPVSVAQPDGVPQQQRPRATMEPDGPDYEASAMNARARRAYRRASSLRRVTNASASSRRPTVGWSDSNDRVVSRSRESSQSRIFGDASHIPNRGGSTPATNGRATPDAATSRRHAWTVGYLDLDGNRRPPLPDGMRREESPRSGGYGLQTDDDGNRLEDGYGVPVDPVDGLGDRRRSLSPEVNSWDTILTTLTADPQLPSAGSSFASSASALAAATEGQSTWASSSQPTVTQTPVVSALPAVPSPVTRGQDDDDDNGTNESTPAPILVEASHMPAWFTEDPPVLTDSMPSGTTSAGTSQRIRSPFTVVSADADTADESAVMFNGLEDEVGDDAACEDSDMDDGVRRDGEEEAAYDEEEEQEAEEARAYLMGLSDDLPARRQGQGATNPMERMFHFENRERPVRTGFGGARPESNSASASASASGNNNNSSSNNNNNNNTEETLDLLGIGGMQHIVRSLARREDIPDEWWAEAGLSRTLPREASN